jgi:hypothetical protein
MQFKLKTSDVAVSCRILPHDTSMFLSIILPFNVQV